MIDLEFGKVATAKAFALFLKECQNFGRVKVVNYSVKRSTRNSITLFTDIQVQCAFADK